MFLSGRSPWECAHGMAKVYPGKHSEAEKVEFSTCGFPKARRVVGSELMVDTASVSAPLCQCDNVGLDVQPRGMVEH